MSPPETASDEWERHRNQIKGLYIDGGMKLRELQQLMSAQGFSKTKSQYERQLKKWGFRKNQTLPRGANLSFIAKRVEKRKRVLGKKSEVFVNGERFAPEKLQKWRLYGKGYETTFEKFCSSSAPSPCTPEDIVVRTPDSMGPSMHPFPRLTWSLSLPWLRFCNLLRSEMDLGSSSVTSASQLSLSRAINMQCDVGLIETLQRLSCIVRSSNSPRPLHADVRCRMSAALSVLMPEEFEGQHEALMTTQFSLELYLLSNSLTSNNGHIRSESALTSQDERTIELFKCLVGSKIKQFTALDIAKKPTVQSIAEKVFASAVRLYDLQVTKVMLAAGVDPNHIIDTVDARVTPLAWAANNPDYRGLRMAKILLQNKADVNKSFEGTTALFPAIRKRNLAVIRELLQYGASVPLSHLAEATETLDVETFSMLSESCVDAVGLYPECIGDRHHSDFLWQTKSPGSGVATLLGAAAKSGNRDILDFVLQKYPVLVERRYSHSLEPYYSPLELALEMDHTHFIEPLILSGVDMDVSYKIGVALTGRALMKQNLQTFHVLLEHGATVDLSTLRAAIHMNYDEMVSKECSAPFSSHCHLIECLILHGAPLNDKDPFPGLSVLGEAIVKGDPSIIAVLLDYGVDDLGREIHRIGSRDAARLLSTRGVLQRLIIEGGIRILENAMLSQDLDLARWLFDNNLIAEMDRTSEDNDALLEAAVSTGDMSLVKRMLDNGSTVTDISLAAAVHLVDKPYGDTKVLKYLLRGFHGSAPSAVACACFARRQDLLEIILATGVCPRGRPKRPQHRLSEHHLDTPKGLSEGTCKVYKPYSALELAVEGGSYQCLRMLIESHEWSSAEVGRAMALAIYWCHGNMVEMLYELDPNVEEEAVLYKGRSGSDVIFTKRATFVKGFTSLQAAAITENVALARRLTGDSRADVNNRAEDHHTALQRAVENGNLELINLLVKYGADVNAAPASWRGGTALQLAAMKGYCGIARTLIDLGAKVNAPSIDEEGRTALEGASEHGRIDIIQLLFDKGASTLDDGGGGQYWRSLFLARKNGHLAAAKLLESCHEDYLLRIAHSENNGSLGNWEIGFEGSTGFQDCHAPGLDDDVFSWSATPEEWQEWLDFPPE